jgi:REP element-mobilizing transposase RayT
MEHEHLPRVRAALNEWSETGDWRLLAGVVMPDHVHVLFSLGDRLPLDRVLA